MAGGFAKDGAVQDQIDATVEDAVTRVRGQLPQGESLTHCEECDKPIPEARRKAVPGVRLCIDCLGMIPPFGSNGWLWSPAKRCLLVF